MIYQFRKNLTIKSQGEYIFDTKGHLIKFNLINETNGTLNYMILRESFLFIAHCSNLSV